MALKEHFSWQRWIVDVISSYTLLAPRRASIKFLLQHASKITGFFKVQNHDSKELIVLFLDQLAFYVCFSSNGFSNTYKITTGLELRLMFTYPF